MLVQVSHTSGSKAEQEMEDLSTVFEVDLSGPGVMLDINDMADWVFSALSPGASHLSPFNVRVDAMRLPGLMMLFSQVRTSITLEQCS